MPDTRYPPDRVRLPLSSRNHWFLVSPRLLCRTDAKSGYFSWQCRCSPFREEILPPRYNPCGSLPFRFPALYLPPGSRRFPALLRLLCPFFSCSPPSVFAHIPALQTAASRHPSRPTHPETSLFSDVRFLTVDSCPPHRPAAGSESLPRKTAAPGNRDCR